MRASPSGAQVPLQGPSVCALPSPFPPPQGSCFPSLREKPVPSTNMATALASPPLHRPRCRLGIADSASPCPEPRDARAPEAAAGLALPEYLGAERGGGCRCVASRRVPAPRARVRPLALRSRVLLVRSGERGGWVGGSGAPLPRPEGVGLNRPGRRGSAMRPRAWRSAAASRGRCAAGTAVQVSAPRPRAGAHSGGLPTCGPPTSPPRRPGPAGVALGM
jgi:hypothetical protein